MGVKIFVGGRAVAGTVVKVGARVISGTLVKVRADVPSVVGVGSAQASRAARATKRAKVIEGKALGMRGGPSFARVHLPFYRAAGPFLCP